MFSWSWKLNWELKVNLSFIPFAFEYIWDKISFLNTISILRFIWNQLFEQNKIEKCIKTDRKAIYNDPEASADVYSFRFSRVCDDHQFQKFYVSNFCHEIRDPCRWLLTAIRMHFQVNRVENGCYRQKLRVNEKQKNFWCWIAAELKPVEDNLVEISENFLKINLHPSKLLNENSVQKKRDHKQSKSVSGVRIQKQKKYVHCHQNEPSDDDLMQVIQVLPFNQKVHDNVRITLIVAIKHVKSRSCVPWLIQ